MKHFSNCLAQLLKERGVMQKELGEALYVSKSRLHHWIKGRAEPDLEMLARIADFFDVSADFLIGREDEFGNPIK